MKTVIIISVILIIIGSVLCLVSLFMFDFDFKNISTVKYDTNSHVINADIHSVKIDVIDADLYFVESSGSETRVECYETDLIYHTVKEDNGTLHIRAVEKKDTKWYEHIGIANKSSKITIYLAENDSLPVNLEAKAVSSNVLLSQGITWENVNVETTSGDIKIISSLINNLNTKTVSGDVEVSGDQISKTLNITTVSGDVDVERINASNIISKTTSGEVDFSDCISDDTINVTTVSGDVELENCDAASLNIETKSGDIDGRLLSDKTFIISTKSGNVRIPKNTFGGTCEVKTVSGDIEFR